MFGVIWRFRVKVSRVIVHDISDLRSVCILISVTAEISSLKFVIGV